MEIASRITQNLFNRSSHGIKFGLDRMRAAAAKLGNPHTAYKSVHVAGTNGKGSTSTFIDYILRENGFKTALFTSPHIVNFEERFIINGKPIKSRQWMDVYQDVALFIEEANLTFFESITLIAFELFKRENVEWAVFETGMGGRLDSTNIITPEACAITTIAMDHTEYLGSDLVSIAGEKLGIVKECVPLILALPAQAEISEAARAKCKALNAPLVFASAQDAKDMEVEGSVTKFTYKSYEFSTTMPGAYQVQNCMVALKTAEAMGFIDLEKAVQGIKKAFLPGRFQVLSIKNRTVVFDVGHNPNAAEQLVKTLQSRFAGQSVCMVTGIMKDKDITSVLERYCRCANRLILTHPDIDRAASAQFLAENIPLDFKQPVQVISSVKSAVLDAFKGPEDVVCICGSFYTVGEAMNALGVRPFEFEH